MLLADDLRLTSVFQIVDVNRLRDPALSPIRCVPECIDEIGLNRVENNATFSCNHPEKESATVETQMRRVHYR